MLNAPTLHYINNTTMPRRGGAKKKRPNHPDLITAGANRFRQAVKNSEKWAMANPGSSPFEQGAHAFVQGMAVPVLAARDSRAVSRGARALAKAGVPYASNTADIAAALGFGGQGGGSSLNEAQKREVSRYQLANAMKRHGVVY